MLQQQDSVISYETAMKSNNEMFTKEMTINENSQFVLPSYDEALKIKVKEPADQQS